jgi:hypothetical protein
MVSINNSEYRDKYDDILDQKNLTKFTNFIR